MKEGCYKSIDCEGRREFSIEYHRLINSRDITDMIVSDFTALEHEGRYKSIDCEGRSLQINSHGANLRSDLGLKFGSWTL